MFKPKRSSQLLKKHLPQQTETIQVDVTFNFDSTHYAGHDLVVYETLYQDGKEVYKHADINDKDQTIRIEGITTGLSMQRGQWTLLALVAAFVIVLCRKKTRTLKYVFFYSVIQYRKWRYMHDFNNCL